MKLVEMGKRGAMTDDEKDVALLVVNSVIDEIDAGEVSCGCVVYLCGGQVLHTYFGNVLENWGWLHGGIVAAAQEVLAEAYGDDE